MQTKVIMIKVDMQSRENVKHKFHILLVEIFPTIVLIEKLNVGEVSALW